MRIFHRPVRVCSHGQAIERKQSIVDIDGKIWRYVCLTDSNLNVAVTEIDTPDGPMRRFPLSHFAISIEQSDAASVKTL